MKPTASNLIRWAGLSAMAAGALFIGIQTVHPVDALESVTTARWVIVHYVSVGMCIFGLFGLTGLFARQAERAGWLGFAGYLMFSLFYVFTAAFQFVEALISPILATETPRFVEGFLGIVTGHASEMSLGALPIVYGVTAGLYMLGSLLLGIATFRARILPRWAAGLLALSGPLAIVMSKVFSHPLDRLAAVPMGLALIGLGYALWAERRATVSETAPDKAGTRLSQVGTD